ncbi:MAG: hypothetical protein JNJ80_03525 [Gemmatimonadetes bacterium]|nr:hypothetical protein [Gemmatimonadota bacterium]MCC7131203.1 hypothetical protein [Gemmatimonadales bacterium]
MSALVRLLYPPPTTSRHPTSVIAWWERRRLAFNLIVGGTGILTLMVANLFAWLPPDRGAGLPPLFAAVVYGVAANLFYTSGWMFEVLFNAWWKDDPPRIGPVLFRQGLLFSIGLTLLPTAFVALDYGFRVLRWIW